MRWKSQEIEEEAQGRLPGYEEAVVVLAQTYGGDWDVALGSVHVVSNEADVQGHVFAAEPGVKGRVPLIIARTALTADERAPDILLA